MGAYSLVTQDNFATIQNAVKAAFTGEQVVIACSSRLQADQVKKMISCSFPYIKQDLIQVEVKKDDNDGTTSTSSNAMPSAS